MLNIFLSVVVCKNNKKADGFIPPASNNVEWIYI
jgi:hypothetical protein